MQSRRSASRLIRKKKNEETDERVVFLFDCRVKWRTPSAFVSFSSPSKPLGLFPADVRFSLYEAQRIFHAHTPPFFFFLSVSVRPRLCRKEANAFGVLLLPSTELLTILRGWSETLTPFSMSSLPTFLYLLFFSFLFYIQYPLTYSRAQTRIACKPHCPLFFFCFSCYCANLFFSLPEDCKR